MTIVKKGTQFFKWKKLYKPVPKSVQTVHTVDRSAEKAHIRIVAMKKDHVEKNFHVIVSCSCDRQKAYSLLTQKLLVKKKEKL